MSLLHSARECRGRVQIAYWCFRSRPTEAQAEPSEIGGRKVFPLRCRSEDLDVVMVFNPQGEAIGFIRPPERCANLAYGGPKRNRLYMASSQSLYALYVEAHAAV